MKKFLLLIPAIAILSGGCFDFEFKPFGCQTYVPQKWHLGQMEAEFDSPKPILKIGDTIHFSFQIPKNFKDIHDQDVKVDRGVQVFVKISTATNQSDTLNTDIFSIDTTIFHVFHQYFETKSIKGSSVNAYTFDCELENGFWKVETEYITRKAGNYWARIQLLEIDSSEADQEDGVCMLGDPTSFDGRIIWKESENNRIDVLFADDKERYPDYYGFMVEE